jgi:hypothetical protein
MDDEDNYRDDILGRKRSHIVDNEYDDDIYNDDDNNDNDDDNYDDNEDDEDNDHNDDVATNDLDDDEVEFVGKPPNDSPPWTNDSLAFAFWKRYNPSQRQLKKRHKKGGEKRSGSNIVNVAQGCNLPSPPPAQGRSRSRSRSNNATVKRGSKAPSPSQGGKKRSGLNITTVMWGGKPPPPPQSWRGSNPQQTQQNKRTKKRRQKRGASLHFSPPLRAGSVVIQVQTPLVPVVPKMIPLQLPNPLNRPNLIE